MAGKYKFTGRVKELEQIDQFINASISEIDGQVMLLVGEEGMGKTALLQAAAVEASKQDHIVALGVIDERESIFSENIYPVIAQIQDKHKPKFKEGDEWLSARLMGLVPAISVLTGSPIAAALVGGTITLGGLISKIHKRHVLNYSSNKSLAEIFCESIPDIEIGGIKRVTIFLDPDPMSPESFIPFFRHLGDAGLPDKVRFIIAQRPDDIIYEEYKKHKLGDLIHAHVDIGRLNKEEAGSFIKSLDIDQRIDEELKEHLIKKYDGWSILLKMAIEELLKIEGEITNEDITSLPSEIKDFWERRYSRIKNVKSLKLLHTVCMLPHPYGSERLLGFSGLSADEIAGVRNDSNVWEILGKEVNEESAQSGDLIIIKHATARDFVVGEIEQSPTLKDELLSNIIAHYRETIGEDLSGANVDRDALEFLPIVLFIKLDISEFLKEVDRLGELKYRYGLLDSVLFDLENVRLILWKSGNIEKEAKTLSNISQIHIVRGESDQALKILNNALEVYNKINGIKGKKGKAIILGNIGLAHQEKGDLKLALESQMESLKLNKEIDNFKGFAGNLLNIGIIYLHQGDSEKSLHEHEWANKMYMESKKMLNESLELYKKINTIAGNEGIAKVHGNLGFALQNLRQENQALEAFQESNKWNEQIGNKKLQAANFAGIGKIYAQQGDRQLAKKNFDLSIELFKEIGIEKNVRMVEEWLDDLE